VIAADEPVRAQLATMLAVRCGWSGVTIADMENGGVQADAKSAPSEIYASRAYLLTSSDRGLPVILNGLGEQFAGGVEAARAGAAGGDGHDAPAYERRAERADSGNLDGGGRLVELSLPGDAGAQTRR